MEHTRVTIAKGGGTRRATTRLAPQLPRQPARLSGGSSRMRVQFAPRFTRDDGTPSSAKPFAIHRVPKAWPFACARCLKHFDGPPVFCPVSRLYNLDIFEVSHACCDIACQNARIQEQVPAFRRDHVRGMFREMLEEALGVGNVPATLPMAGALARMEALGGIVSEEEERALRKSGALKEELVGAPFVNANYVVFEHLLESGSMGETLTAVDLANKHREAFIAGELMRAVTQQQQIALALRRKREGLSAEVPSDEDGHDDVAVVVQEEVRSLAERLEQFARSDDQVPMFDQILAQIQADRSAAGLPPLVAREETMDVSTISEEEEEEREEEREEEEEEEGVEVAGDEE